MSNQYTVNELKEIFSNEGYHILNFPNIPHNVIFLEINGDGYIINLLYDGIQIIYRAIHKRPFSLDKINQWNSENLLGKLHRDEDDENVLFVKLVQIGLGEKLEAEKIIMLIELFQHIITTIDFDHLLQ